jgi:endonuclease YncB( thermonuclease family)
MAAIPAVVCCHCFFLGLSSVGLAATDFSGPVVSVLDGDTVEVLHKQHPERIRLNGIDCPEKGQAFGTRAKQAASELVFGKDVTLQARGHDKYGRTIADVLLPDCTNVNHELVKDGWGGIGSMRQAIPCLNGWGRKRERPRRACGLIRSRCRRGSTGISVEPLKVYFLQ